MVKNQRDNPFSADPKFSEKLTCLTTDTLRYVRVSDGKTCKFLRKFCLRIKWMIPNLLLSLFSNQIYIHQLGKRKVSLPSSPVRTPSIRTSIMQELSRCQKLQIQRLTHFRGVSITLSNI